MQNEVSEMKKAIWHYHHSTLLVEFPAETIESRHAFIDTDKLASERALRHRLLRPVIGELPVSLTQAGKAYIRARQAYIQADQAYTLADRARTQAHQAWRQAYQAWRRADQAWTQADQARTQADQAYIQAHQAWTQADRAWTPAHRAYIQADRAYTQAYQAWRQAGQAYTQAYRKNLSTISALHAIECPDCPWDTVQDTIFTRQNGDGEWY